VSLHRSLGQPEAALGVLTYAQQRLRKRAMRECAHHGDHLRAGTRSSGGSTYKQVLPKR
jgi:hypothetical protein